MKSAIMAPAAIFLPLAGFTSDARAKTYAQYRKEIAALLDRHVAAASAKNIDGIMNECVPSVFVLTFIWQEAAARFNEVELHDLTVATSFYGFAPRLTLALGVTAHEGFPLIDES